MAALPSRVSVLLQEVSDRLQVILDNDLVGVYLYGSLTQRAFNPERSDVDCIVVTKRAVSDVQFRRLSAWLAESAGANPWTRRLQMTFLIKGELLTEGSRACLYQFGRLDRTRSDGNPIIWMNVLKSGVVLYGTPPASFVPPITREIFFRALEREVGYLREEISTKPDSEWRDIPSYRAYAVLTLCRILYSFKKFTVVSKPRGARWALKHLPEEFGSIIAQALEASGSTGSTKIPLLKIKRFIAYAQRQLRD